VADYDYDIGIIGGGAAGLTVASGAAQLGAKTLLLEKEEALGGDCLHFGCVPSKTLIRTAHVYHLMKHAPRFGLPAVDLPPVDFAEVAGRIRSVIDTIQQHDSEERFCGLGAKVMFGSPAFEDDRAVRIDGKSISAKNWVIATGSSAAIPPIEGLDATPYITNREIFSLGRLPESLMILGGGPIGVEMAQAFARLGTRVSVIELAGQILGKEDPDMAEAVESALREEGVIFHLNTEVTAARDLGAEREVTVKDAAGKTTTLRGEQLLIALGRRPNVDDLALDKAGVEVGRGGITVDARMRTNRKHIYAAGDCNGGFQFTHAAGYEGGIVVSNAVFRLPRKADYTFMPWCTYTDPELASIGMNEKMAAAAGIEPKTVTEEFKNNDRSLAEAEPVGRIKLVLDERENPVGVQIFGPRAGELIGEWVAAFNGKVKLSTLAGAVHPYPTVGEINKKVVGNLYSPKIFSDTVKKGLKFFFNLKGRACGLEKGPR
jgi:pyruvate/2-oxoglutarate dehydrogenase complex dihydrolipoamide dehydrogenase (E3) component